MALWWNTFDVTAPVRITSDSQDHVEKWVCTNIRLIKGEFLDTAHLTQNWATHSALLHSTFSPNRTQLPPVVHSQTLLVIILVPCGSKKVRETNFFSHTPTTNGSCFFFCHVQKVGHYDAQPAPQVYTGVWRWIHTPLHLNDKGMSTGIYLNANEVLSHTPFTLHRSKEQTEALATANVLSVQNKRAKQKRKKFQNWT